jgi:hypothetical protein
VVEGRQKIHEPDFWLVSDGQYTGTIHIPDGSSLQVAWGEILLLVFRGLDASSLYNIHFRHELQLGCHHLQIVEHLHKTSLDVKEGETLSFYMASYLLDAICARNVFSGMNLNWHSYELSFHVYFNILWENRYKKSHSLFCDQFIARIYFLLFNKECPRLSDEENMVISKVGHWYLDE